MPLSPWLGSAGGRTKCGCSAGPPAPAHDTVTTWEDCVRRSAGRTSSVEDVVEVGTRPFAMDKSALPGWVAAARTSLVPGSHHRRGG